ncbi:hypothetical protein [Streptomyces sp. NPDC048638]|uniref:hypothetical protein n=1 Tax=Streptomyces sp. NPDC048638 TaxID=3365580 RepID=UPI00371EB425
MTTAPVLATRLSPSDLDVLGVIAQGANEVALRDQGVYASCNEARREVAGLGRVLAGGTPIRWTRIVHLSVVHRLVPVDRSADVWLPPWQLDLLCAWASGISLTEYAYEASLSHMEAKELEQLLCHNLSAVSDQHAVLRGHEAGTLTARDPLTVTFNGTGETP